MGNSSGALRPLAKLAPLGPPIMMTGVFVSRTESSALGLTTDFWGGFLLSVGLVATAIWIASTVTDLMEKRGR